GGRAGGGLPEGRPGRPERETPGAEHVEHELLVALVDPGCRERDALRRGGAQAACDMLGTSSRHSERRSSSPRAGARDAFWSSSLTRPTPISWSSTERTGVTSDAVPHMNTSSAR